MGDLNNFIIIDGIQNFTAIIKSKETMLPLQHLKDVKRAVAVILCVDLDIEMQSSYPKESIMSRKRIITLFLF